MCVGSHRVTVDRRVPVTRHSTVGADHGVKCGLQSRVWNAEECDWRRVPAVVSVQCEGTREYGHTSE